MSWFTHAKPPRRYLLAILTVILTTAILYLLQDSLSTPIVSLLYLLPVGLSTTLWGLGAGIAAASGAFIAFNYFFIQPLYTFTVHQTQDLLALVVFLVVATLISQLVARAQTNLARATVREHEATHLYELSTALVGLREQKEIARKVAEQIKQVFQAEVVAITVRLGADPLLLCLPEGAEAPARPPTCSTPLMMPRGLLGELQLWRQGEPLSGSEARLLQTFASQGALALESALLADTENRAKVLEESDRLKSALLSSVSHELRTPLVTIKAAATSLLSAEMEWDGQTRQELLTAVATEADHLNRLVGNLLDMSRIEAGALHPKRQWNILGEIVRDVNSRLRRTAEHHTIILDVPDALPLVPVDYLQMDQVFTNLLSNCLKYAPPHTTIRVQAWVEGVQVRVQVSNEGPPVPEEQLEQIFDKFSPVAAMTPNTSTGLGLSICKGIIELHGGRIWAENLPAGFAFHFTLPLAAAGMSPPKLPVEESEQ
ncbi:MAG: DUF4118 domain-containing protein [Chloroflexi bacterium]|nr:DUF4118 domain-containing protein [Chloroflexota bacterium]MBP8056466.1 DUF4118 domain-containing protein [Chloroflexota bacterium]